MASDPSRPPRKVRFQPKPPGGRQGVFLGKKANDHQPQAEKKFVNADGSICDTNLYSSSDEEYKEPWDYKKSYYPTTLPLRRPCSGDPEILDDEEFGAKAASSEKDENATNAALKLGLRPVDVSKDPRMIFFQIPENLPLHRETPTRPNVVKDCPSMVAVSSASGGTAMSSNITEESSESVGGDLESLPAGYMGKLVVYKSGAVKWKMGDHLFDVSPGVTCNFRQEVVAINEAEEHCIALGKIEECRAIVTPDFDA